MVEAVAVHPLLEVTVRLYVPDIPVVALPDTVGDWLVLEKEFGPLQEYVFPEAAPVRVRALPVHTGPLFDAVAVGGVFTVTATI